MNTCVHVTYRTRVYVCRRKNICTYREKFVGKKAENSRKCYRRRKVRFRTNGVTPGYKQGPKSYILMSFATFFDSKSKKQYFHTINQLYVYFITLSLYSHTKEKKCKLITYINSTLLHTHCMSFTLTLLYILYVQRTNRAPTQLKQTLYIINIVNYVQLGLLSHFIASISAINLSRFRTHTYTHDTEEPT